MGYIVALVSACLAACAAAGPNSGCNEKMQIGPFWKGAELERKSEGGYRVYAEAYDGEPAIAECETFQITTRLQEPHAALLQANRAEAEKKRRKRTGNELDFMFDRPSVEHDGRLLVDTEEEVLRTGGRAPQQQEKDMEYNYQVNVSMYTYSGKQHGPEAMICGCHHGDENGRCARWLCKGPPRNATNATNATNASVGAKVMPENHQAHQAAKSPVQPAPPPARKEGPLSMGETCDERPSACKAGLSCRPRHGRYGSFHSTCQADASKWQAEDAHVVREREILAQDAAHNWLIVKITMGISLSCVTLLCLFQGVRREIEKGTLEEYKEYADYRDAVEDTNLRVLSTATNYGRAVE